MVLMVVVSNGRDGSDGSGDVVMVVVNGVGAGGGGVYEFNFFPSVDLL